MSDRFLTRKATQQRRKQMSCKVFSLKIDNSHLSNDTVKHLNQIFLEAKWFFNYCISLEDINAADTTVLSVPVKIGKDFEQRDLTVLTSHIKQGIKTRIFNALSTLKTMKEKGLKTGRVTFKSIVNSINLKEFGRTFDIDRNHIRIQGLKKWLRVCGSHQIPKDAEIANATLIRRPSGFYLSITTFTEKKEKVVPETSIGIDFGCQTQLTFSNGIKAEFQVPISKRLLRLDRRIMRNNRPESKKKRQDRIKRAKEYEHLTNKKKDIRHKIVSAITKTFKYVCFQDENIHAWHAGNHGKKIQNSGIGGIISDLKHKSVTPLEVHRFFPSTQLCPTCGSKKRLYLNERTYECGCGYKEDRDVKSALCIEAEGIKRVPVDNRDFKAREISASTFFDRLSKISCIKVSKLELMN